jgi:hypothetical protein
MIDLQARIEEVEAWLRDRVSNQAGLGYVPYPTKRRLGDSGVGFDFPVRHPVPHFPSIELTRDELAAPQYMSLLGEKFDRSVRAYETPSRRVRRLGPMGKFGKNIRRWRRR